MFWGYRVPRFTKNIEKVSATSAIHRITYNMSNFFQSVRPPTMTTEDGKPYTRSPEVEAQIAETLHWSGADLLGKHKSLLNETLVYHVRRFRERDEHLCGVLLHELAQRTTRTVKAAMHGIDPLGKADIAMQVEVEVLELAIAPEPSRQSEFLEIAFTQAVKRRALNRREQFKGTVQGHRGRYKPKPWVNLDEHDKERRRPLEFAPDSRNGPESAVAAFQDEQFREQAYEIVRAALEGEDDRLMLGFRLHVVDRWPLWSADPKVPTVARHFSLTRGQAKYLFEKTRKIIDEVLSAYVAGKRMTARAGVQK